MAAVSRAMQMSPRALRPPELPPMRFHELTSLFPPFFISDIHDLGDGWDRADKPQARALLRIVLLMIVNINGVSLLCQARRPGAFHARHYSNSIITMLFFMDKNTED